MGDYTPEPPRKDCVLHLSFDHIDGDSALDLSPQKNDAVINGEPEPRTGAVGNGLFLDVDSYVEHDNPITSDRQSEFTFAAWVEMEEKAGSDQRQNFVKHGGDTTAYLRFEGTNFEFAVSTDADGWVRATGFEPEYGEQYFVVGVYDRTNMRLYVDGQLVATAKASENPTSSGGAGYIGTYDPSTERANAVHDEVRMYRKPLSEAEIHGLQSIGLDHNSINELADAWDNPGIPFRGNNIRFAGSLGEEKDAVKRQLDYIREARHIEDASGDQLDRIGKIAGIKRKEGEKDPRYRARIIGTLAAGRSSGTFDDIIHAVAAILDTSIDRVEVQKAWQQDPSAVATAYIYVRTADLDDSALTLTDLTQILKDVVLAGHDVEVIEQGANPFTVIDDTQANDPERGLTSDSISTGGGLVSDV